MSGRSDQLGGTSRRPPASIGRYAPSNTILIPPADLALESGEVSHPFLDILTVISAFLFVSLTGVGFALAIAVLFFVDLH